MKSKLIITLVFTFLLLALFSGMVNAEANIFLAPGAGGFAKYSPKTNIMYNLNNTDLNNWLSGNTITTMTSENISNYIYLAGSGGLFGRYNIITNTSVNLTEIDVSNWIGTTQINKIKINKNTKEIYFALNGGKFGVYNITSNSLTDLSNTDTANWMGTDGVYSLDINLKNNLVYLVLGNGKFGVYNKTSNVLTDLSSTDTANWMGTYYFYNVAVNQNNGLVYTVASTGKFGVYNKTSNILTDLSSTDTANWMGADEIFSVSINQVNNLVYITSLSSGKFGVYNKTSNVLTDLSTTDAANWIGLDTIYETERNAENNLIYATLDTGKFGAYNKTSNVFVDLSTTDSGNWRGTKASSAMNINYYVSSSNATITAKSLYNGSTINSFSVRIQNGSTIRTQYTSTGTITTRINSTYATKYKYNITFYNNSDHFNKTYLNYNFSIHSNNAQGNLTRSFIYANVRSNFNLASITFNATVNGITTYLAATKNTKLYLEDNNLNDISFSAIDYKTQLVSNINTSSNLTVTLNRTYQYIFPRNKSSNLPIAYFNISNGTHTYLNAQNTTKIYCYNICNFSISSKNFMNSYFSKDSSTNKNINLTYAINKIYFKNNFAVPISGLLVYITYPSGYFINRTTNSLGMINFSSIPLTLNETGTYSFYINDLIGYITPITITENLTSANIPFTKNYTISNSSIVIKTYNINGTELTGITSFSAQGTIYSFNGVTNSSGEKTKYNIQEDIYEIVFTRSGYNSVSYYVNFSNRETVYLNVYLINSTTGNEKVFYTKDSTLLSPIANTLITFTKQINGSYVSIGQIVSDGIGFGSIYLENNIKYRLQIEAEGYTTKILYLSTVVSLSSYDILLDPQSTLNFTEFYDYFNYYISPKGNKNLKKGINSFNLTTSSSGSFINWFAVKYGATVNNVSGSPAGGMATINLNVSALPEYFTVYYYINIDNYDTIIKAVTYHTSQSTYDTSFIDSQSDNPISSNKNKGIFVTLLIALFLLIANKMFDIDRADGSKTFNSLLLLMPIILFIFIGFIDPIIGTVVSVLLVFTLIPRGDY